MKQVDFKDLLTLSREFGVLDNFYLMDVIDTYNNGDFVGMTRLIKEFGEHRFFQDLYVMFENQTWRSRTNQYLNFVGITIEYMKFRIKEEDPAAAKPVTPQRSN
jgi:hypothetical protein